ncbi:hypothetical protein TRIUR3_09474 [Triticum urartu]|uniref:Uncharacterized protein n=1 Tax=Triticum urartu TaxID=4572 RepID=M8B0E6_TRIUA|nr:hypothetical protein TRIUR3_09474 [Triticum urartu]
MRMKSRSGRRKDGSNSFSQSLIALVHWKRTAVGLTATVGLGKAGQQRKASNWLYRRSKAQQQPAKIAYAIRVTGSLEPADRPFVRC